MVNLSDEFRGRRGDFSDKMNENENLSDEKWKNLIWPSDKIKTNKNISDKTALSPQKTSDII